EGGVGEQHGLSFLAHGCDHHVIRPGRTQGQEELSMTGAQLWIDGLQLRRHPEGGWFRETYRSEEVLAGDALPPRFGGDRAFSTAIYFLLDGEDFSALHRI